MMKFELDDVFEDFYVDGDKEDIYADFNEDWNDGNLAFVKYDTYEGDKMWIIYGADGSRIAATSDRDFAFIVARQNDLQPCSVH